ncbi:MAG: response regulator transcription factor [Candidatus Dormibacter sp.]
MGTANYQSCRIAVCDDRDDYRGLLYALIRRAGGLEIVGEARNGAEAVSIAETLQPDVMLLDLAMPVMDGMEALPKIVEVSPATRVIVLTGFSSQSMRIRAMEAGASGFIEKGERPAVLIDTVRAACARD